MTRLLHRRTLIVSGLGLALGQTDAASSRPKAGDLFVKAGDTPLPAVPLNIEGGTLAVAQPSTAPFGFEKG